MINLSTLVDELIKNETIVCPKCHSSISNLNGRLVCLNEACAGEIDLIQQKVPILVDFTKDTVLDREALLATSGESLIPRTDNRNSLPKQILWGRGSRTRQNLESFLRSIPRTPGYTPIVLIVGGGAIGRGTSALFTQKDLKTLSFDIYASANTDLIADAHDIPLANQSVDAVWIQAVLEHVLYPNQVAAEIERVLKVGGIVYAETPFLQNVHEGAYDFTRFTESGHRLLFSGFSLIDSGFLNGIGTVLLWNIRYLLWGLTRSRKLATILLFPFFWIRFLEKLIPDGVNVDSASGVYFLGQKKPGEKTSSRDIIRHYKGYQHRS